MRQNVKRTIAFAETVAMIATLTVGITFGNTTQVKADITSRTNNIHNPNVYENTHAFSS